MNQADTEAYAAFWRAGVRYRLARRVASELRRLDERDGFEMANALEHARAEYASAFCRAVARGCINGAEGGLIELLKGAE